MDIVIGTHIPEEFLEEFAMDILADQQCAVWEEHLLVCELCQDRLDEADEYIRDMKAALVEMSDSAVGDQRRLAKPMTAASHA
jgi:hypothetical protein